MADRLPRLSELRRSDAGGYGTKAANLGELINAGFGVPPGFVVPSAMRGTGRSDLIEVLGPALADLGARSVAVRSSALGEDSAVSSHAGAYDTFTDVAAMGPSGVQAVAVAVHRCWTSLDSARSVAYRRARGIGGVSEMAVVVQKMVPAEFSGVAFSVDPVSGDPGMLVVESVRGPGRQLVSGTARPERFRVPRSRVRSEIGSVSGDGGVMLSDVATMVIAVEAHMGTPVDIEWCWAAGTLHLVQARPVTGVRPDVHGGNPGPATHLEPVLSGTPACPGVVTGPVRIVGGVAQIDEVLDGEVLVTRFTSPEWMPALVRCAALVAEVGGVTSHAAIVSRELGLPCVVGAETAMEVLDSGDTVTVDGASGVVYRESGL